MSLFNSIDLFTAGEVRKIEYDLTDAEVTLYENFFTKEESDRLYSKLLKETLWQQDEIVIYNKRHLIPRLNAW